MLSLPLALLAQETVQVNEYEFTKVNDVDVQPVQNQFRTGTCWSFSTLSFMESEVKRIKGMDVKLAEMWIVRHTYLEKAERYIRFHGNINFEAGGAFHDVTAMIEKYGIVPQSEFPGLSYGSEKHNHGELNSVLKAMCAAIVKNPNRTLTTSWKKAIEGVINAYLGEPVTTFKYDGKTYNPKSFAKHIGIVASDYVILSSFTHQPMHKEFILELPDNWMHETAYNVTLDEFMSSMNGALDKGYSIAWASDVSEKGFAHRNGVAVVPVGNWMDLKTEEIKEMLKKPMVQEKVTAEMRQLGYDNYQTTDDHGMHITGVYKDQNGVRYFKVKNSWGLENSWKQEGQQSSDCDGYLFASEAYVRYKTIDVMVHKDALSKSLKKTLGIK